MLQLQMSNSNFDRNVRMYDEGYTPAQLEAMQKNQNLGKGALLDDFFSDSYLLQMRKIYGLKPANLLEVGPGEGFMKHYLEYMGIEFDTLDIKGEPTYRSTLEAFVPSDHGILGKYDLVCVFQML